MMKLKLPQSKFLKERLEKFSRKQRIVVIIFAAALIISGGIFVLAELGGYGVNGPATAPNSLDYGLVGHWDMEEGSGQVIKDKSGNGNDGTLGANSSVGTDDPVFAPGHDSSGDNGTGLKFDGADDYVDAGNGSSLKSGSVTVEAMFKISGGNGVDRRIISMQSPLSAGYGYELYINTSNGISFRTRDAGTGWMKLVSSNAAYTDSNWHNATGIYSPDGMFLYIDGALQTNTDTYAGPIAYSGSNTLKIGKESHPSYPSYFNGSIDEVRIYNRALSADEVRLLYNQKKPILDLKFDEGSGTIAHDESLNNYDGTLGGDGLGTDLPTWGAGKNGGALDFDGDDDYVGAGNVLNMGLSDYTLNAWFKESSSSSGAVYGLVGKSKANNDNGRFTLVFENGLLEIIFSVGGPILATTSETPYLDNNWHLATATFSRNGDMVLYVDGISKDSADISSFANTDMATSASFFVGAYQDSTGTGVYSGSSFPGSIDNVRVYNYARTQDEVLVDYNEGMAAHLGENNQDLNRGLVGYWDMEEGSGQTIKDKSGNGNDGTLGTNSSASTDDPVFAPGHDSSGENGTGMKFDGTDDYVNLGNGGSLNSNTAFTYSCWVKWSGNNKGGYGGIVENINRAHENSRMLIVDSTSKILVQYEGTSVLTSNFTLQQNTFYYITLVWNGTAPYLYVNGNLDTTGSNSTFAAVTSENIKLGVGAFDSGTYYLNGILDDFRLYGRALSTDEIRQLYNQKKPVLEMKLDEGSGTIAHDESFNNNDGTITGATWAAGKNGSGLSFDGSGDYITFSNHIFNGLEKSYTKSIWMKTASASALNLISGGDAQHVLYVENGYIYMANTWTTPVISTAANFYDNQWHHIEATYGSNWGKIYFDGQLLKEGALNDIVTDADTYIGAFVGSYSFTGSLDNVRIYNYARTADEVLVDYNDGQAVHLGKNNQDLNSGLVGYWDMEEGSGQAVKDRTGNGNNGTLGTSSAVDAADPDFVAGHDSSGSVGTGLGCDGGSDYVDVGTGTSLSLTHTGAISLWIKPNSLTQDDFAGFVTKRNNTAGGTAAGYSYSFHWRKGDSVIRLALSDGATLNYATMPLLSDTNWHHIVGMWDGTNIKLYKDGVLAATPVSQVLDAQAGTTFNTVIGGNSFSTSAVNRQEFNGTIDEVRIYNRALTQDEINTLYNQKKSVLEMKFDEGSGTVAHDESFNNSDGTLGGDGVGTDLPTWTTGKFGTALNFDGSNDYVGLGSWDLTGVPRTVSLWVKSTDNPSSLTDKRFFSGNYFEIRFDGGYLNSRIFDSAFKQLNYTASNLSPNTWYHIVATTGTNSLNLYVNGVVVNTNNTFAPTSHSDTLNIGAGYDSGNNFNGVLDDVRIYNYTRTASEVLVDYNNGLAAHLR